MPTYTNGNAVSTWVVGLEVAAGETIETRRYLSSRDIPSGVTLTLHTPRAEGALVDLYSAAPGGAAVTDIVDYDTLFISNQSDNDATITFNADATTALVLADGMDIVMQDLEKRYYQFAVTGAGSGSVYVWGFK